jgi:hypothetical protein
MTNAAGNVVLCRFRYRLEPLASDAEVLAASTTAPRSRHLRRAATGVGASGLVGDGAPLVCHAPHIGEQLGGVKTGVHK